MVKGQLTEKEFIKTRFDDIINVTNLFEGIVEYAIEDNNVSDTLTLYRFKNNKNIGIFEIDKDDLDDILLDKHNIKTINFISTVASIILYSLVFANIDTITAMNPELVCPLIMLHLYTIIKSIRYSFSGFSSIEKAIEVNIVDAIGLIPIIALLSIISFNKQNYLMIGFYVLIAFLISLKYLLNVLKCTNSNNL